MEEAANSRGGDGEGEVRKGREKEGEVRVGEGRRGTCRRRKERYV